MNSFTLYYTYYYTQCSQACYVYTARNVFAPLHIVCMLCQLLDGAILLYYILCITTDTGDWGPAGSSQNEGGLSQAAATNEAKGEAVPGCHQSEDTATTAGRYYILYS